MSFWMNLWKVVFVTSLLVFAGMAVWVSIGGMRVQPNETLVPGDEVKVAVHVRTRSEPLVVDARVTRDDGKSGLVLEFFNLSGDNEAYLRKMVNLLPIMGVKADVDGESPSGLIVSEIVERKAS